MQRLIRTQAAGVDRIQGWLKAELEPSERNVTLHVAFCPPFDEMPNLTVVQIAGPECRIKTGQLLPYGVRLELKRQRRWRRARHRRSSSSRPKHAALVDSRQRLATKPTQPLSPAPSHMARWPRHVWTTIFTYLVIFIGFPLLCWLAYAWVQGGW